MKRYNRALMLLMGTIIGAGILGLPYMYAQAGYLTGIFNLALVGVAAFFMIAYVGELTMHYPGKHQLTGYVGKFLGKKWQKVAIVIETFGIYTALIAYYIGIGTALGNLFGIDPKIISTIFFIITTPFIYFGTKSVSKGESFLMALKISLILVFFFILMPKVNVQNLTEFDAKKILLPFGITLFSLLGYTVMPEVSQVLKHKDKIKKIAIVSIVLSAIIYVIFTIGFVGAFGKNVAQIPTQSLTQYRWLGDILVFLILSTPFLALSLAVRDVYYLDLKLRKSAAWFFACLIPYLIYLFGNVGFANLLSISGAYTGGGLGLLSMFAVLNARKKSKLSKRHWITKSNYPIYFAIGVMLAGITYQTLWLVGVL